MSPSRGGQSPRQEYIMDYEALDRFMESLTPEELRERMHRMMIARMKADITRKQRERALQGYVEIKLSDFN